MPEPAISFFILSQLKLDILTLGYQSHVIWCELQSVISSQIQPAVQPAHVSHIVWIYKQGLKGLRAGYPNKTPMTSILQVLLFLQELNLQNVFEENWKKNYFCHPPQKSFFSRFLQSSSLKVSNQNIVFSSYNNFHFTSHRSRFKNRTKQVRFYLLFNYHLQFPNKSVASHGWRLRQ